MNTSLYFNNLTPDEIRQILNVVSVPYLMEPLKKNPEKYLKGKNIKSLSREAVNHIYLQFLVEQDIVLSLFLSDVVVDIIHYFKLSDDFKNLLTSDDPEVLTRLNEKIEKRACPINVDMFMRLLDKHPRKKQEAKFFDVEEEKESTEDLLEKLQEVNEFLSQENEALNEENKNLKEELSTYKNQLSKYEDEINVYKGQVEQLNESCKNVTLVNDEKLKDLNFQLMNLQVENKNLKEENRELLFHVEDDSEVEALKRDMKQLIFNYRLLEEENKGNKEALSKAEDYKDRYNQALLDLRETRIQHISLQAEVDQLRYSLKNDNKKLKELKNRGRNLHDEQGDWMMAMHDLTWYKKQWNIPGDAPLSKIWAHLNEEEGKTLSKLLKEQTKMLRTEKVRQMDILREILIVKNAILILLNQEKDFELD